MKVRSRFLCMVIALALLMMVSVGAAISFTVPGNVPKLKQPLPNACWATAAAILLSWKGATTITPKDAAIQAGVTFDLVFTADTGLAASDKPALLTALKLKAEDPQNFSIGGWLSLLQNNGPLWVTTNEGGVGHFSVHARVIRGIIGDGTTGAGTSFILIDPATGAETIETVSAFVKKLEDIAKADLGAGADLRPQVVHF